MFNALTQRLVAAVLAVCSTFFISHALLAQCSVSGGTIAFENGGTELTIIVDGTPDPLEVVPAGDQIGPDAGWVITDLQANILGLPAAPPFDLDPAGTGTCLIWHLRSEGVLMGAAVGNNASDIQGCFSLSNPLTVERLTPDDVNGGNIALDDGSTATSICVDGVADPLNVNRDGTANGENTAWVITDTNGEILGLPAAPPFDLDPAGPGTCLIWYLAWDGMLSGAAVGNNAADLMGDFDLSNPITVERNQVDGGSIALASGATVVSIVVDGVADPLDVVRDGTATGSNSAWVITDANANILALPPAPPFDLDPAGTGTCLIWYLRFEDGLMGAAVGNNAADLVGCFDLSNPITVERLAPDDVNGGNITLDGGGTSTSICVDGVADPLNVNRDGTANGENTAWVITDANANILALPAAPPFDLDPAGPGTCLVWYLAWDGMLTGAAVGNNAADLMGDFDLSNPITVERNQVDGGGIALANGATVVSIVVDGVADPLDVVRDGTATGSNSAWVITDANANILALPPAPPFDLDPAGTGTCLIWYLRFEDGLMGAAVGNNAADLVGCFDLSNPITVERLAPDDVNGGNITLDGGGTSTSICVDGVADPLNVNRDGTANGENTAWVITDANANILALPAAPPFDLDPAGPGTCLIWYLAWDGMLTGAAVGNNAADLMGDFDLSNPITVERNQVDGGGISLANGATVVSIVVDGVADPLDVVRDGTATGSNSAWVITDANANILALPPAPPFDLDPAGTGTCLIWYLRFEDGLMGAAVGNNAADLVGCFDLSNPITVERLAPDDVNGGNITLDGGGTSTSICVDGVADPLNVNRDGTANGENTAWVITDANANILALPAAPPFDLDPAGPGTCLIWYLAWDGMLTGAAVGNNAADLMGDFDLSNPITVERNQVDGGGISLANGATVVSIVVDGVADPLDVVRDGTATGSNSAWVITDANANILALPPAPPFDLDPAGTGTCLIWYLRFEDGLMGAAVGNNAADLVGCFDLSNPITVERLAPDDVNGGNITLDGGGTSTSICVDGVADPLNVNRDGTANGENTAWVITDANANILALPAAPPFDLDPAGPGTCLIWYLAWDGMLTGAAVGNNAADLMGDFDLSNPITVERNQVDGGGITLADGSTMTTIIVDGNPDPLDVVRDGTATGTNSAWVITDANANILALPSAPPFDLDGAGIGTCLIWYLRFEDGLTGAAVGNNAADLVGCFDLSNPITVDRVPPSGGNGPVVTGDISMPSGATTRYTCPGNDGPIQVQLNYNASAANVAYVITDSNFNIIGIQNDASVDASGAPPGVCYIFAFNYTGMITGQVGDLVYSTQFSNDTWLISNNAIRVVREAPDGGTVQTQEGTIDVSFCLDGFDKFVGFVSNGASSANFVYVITDDQNNILGVNDQGFQNFAGAGAGICRVWGLSYTGMITAQPGDNAATTMLTNRCFDLSDNFITVTRYEDVDGGTIAASTGGDRASATASNPVVNYAGSSSSMAPYAYFILGPDQRIRAITFDQSFDFSTLDGADTYYVYGVSHQGTVLAQVGDVFWGLQVTDACFERSDNALVVSYNPNARPAFAARPASYQTIRLSLIEAVDRPLLSEATQAPAVVQVTDAFGRVLAYRTLNTYDEVHGLELDLPTAQSGLHVVTVQTGADVSAEKVLLSVQ